MAKTINTIKKRSTFIFVRNNGKFIRSKSINLQILEDKNLNNSILIGYVATKNIGNAVIRNRAKRLMRELARKVITKYGKINSYYVLIAKPPIFEIPFRSQEIELKRLIS